MTKSFRSIFSFFISFLVSHLQYLTYILLYSFFMFFFFNYFIITHFQFYIITHLILLHCKAILYHYTIWSMIILIFYYLIANLSRFFLSSACHFNSLPSHYPIFLPLSLLFKFFLFLNGSFWYLKFSQWKSFSL